MATERVQRGSGGTAIIQEKNMITEISDVYEKPAFKKELGLVFPKEVIEEISDGRFCVQCSSCHGCK